MANILLTNSCVRECPYCFAGEEMGKAPSSEYISWENVVYLADLLVASGERRVSLLGGEPTLHPEFVDILVYFTERGFNVSVFTCGIMSKARLDELATHVAAIAPDRLTFVCNINNPRQTKTADSEAEKLEAFLTALGRWTMPAFNIYRPDFELDFIFDLVERHGLRRKLRLGIAHPIPGAGNLSIPVEQIEGLMARIAGYRADFERLRLKLTFDCGFPLCKVTDEQLGWLTRLSGRVNFKCHPAVDFTPDMQVYCCFPLASLAKKSVFDFNSFKEITAYYRKLQERVRAEMPGIYPECGSCDHRAERTCAGGAACQIVKKLAEENPARLRDIEHEQLKACLS